MKSDEFESRINELLDGRVAPASDPEIAEAARNSVELRTLLASYTAVINAVELLPVPDCSTDLAERVVVRLRVERAAPVPSILALPQRAWFLAAAAAVAIVVAIPLAQVFQPRQPVAKIDPAPSGSASTGPVAVAPTAAVPAVGATSVDPAKRLVAAKRLAGYADVVRRTGVAIADLALLMPELPLQSELAVDTPTPTDSQQPDVVEQVGHGLEPLANSAVGALDFLFQVLPQSDGSRS